MCDYNQIQFSKCGHSYSEAARWCSGYWRQGFCHEKQIVANGTNDKYCCTFDFVVLAYKNASTSSTAASMKIRPYHAFLSIMPISINESDLREWGLTATMHPKDGTFTDKLYCEKMNFYFNIPEEILNSAMINVLHSSPNKAVCVDAAQAAADSLEPCKAIPPVQRMEWITSFLCVVDLLLAEPREDAATRRYICRMVSRFPNLWFPKDGERDTMAECLASLLLDSRRFAFLDPNNDVLVADLNFGSFKPDLYWVVSYVAMHLCIHRNNRARRFTLAGLFD
ncbi:hypothetical protein BKA67DRAFT_540311 [Truncatella angustata]|uniref:Uncharacterized protein n=1 Tax=Truncatella angustata TaxID=152316 RepID=A0A9P8RIU4_9PEZI|nr:uncharacterized protein BKA67DRAFT_540311 [Truncatella angustata]KAH6646838.1 hypothetical protein BKA67DRAFT_540311 [Truncatella angustata]